MFIFMLTFKAFPTLPYRLYDINKNKPYIEHWNDPTTGVAWSYNKKVMFLNVFGSHIPQLTPIKQKQTCIAKKNINFRVLSIHSSPLTQNFQIVTRDKYCCPNAVTNICKAVSRQSQHTRLGWNTEQCLVSICNY